MSQNIPSDSELDAAVARIEPRLFMRLGAQSRSRRWARVLGGTAAGASLVAAGLAVGVFLVPAPTAPANPVAGPTATPSAQPPIASSIVCHDEAGKVIARIQLAANAKNPAAFCAAVAAPELPGGVNGPTFGANSGKQVTCAGARGIADVYPSKSGDATITCATLNAQPYGDGK